MNPLDNNSGGQLPPLQLISTSNAFTGGIPPLLEFDSSGLIATEGASLAPLSLTPEMVGQYLGTHPSPSSESFMQQPPPETLVTRFKRMRSKDEVEDSPPRKK